MSIKSALQSQYLAALAMLREAIIKCPPAAWNAPRDKDKTWFKAYHAVYYGHKYLQAANRDSVSWKGHTKTNGGAPISRQELLEYLSFVQAQVAGQLRAADMSAESGFHGYPVDRLEMHLINIRHIQQHAGELYERLGTRGKVRLRWAGHIHRNPK